jgi:hypothetical protein
MSIKSVQPPGDCVERKRWRCVAKSIVDSFQSHQPGEESPAADGHIR